MKLIIAVATTAIVSSLTVITPAQAQNKDPACIEKCNRDNKVEGGGRQVRGTGQLIRTCISACPAAAKASGKAK
jgi:hypothetical protein